MTLSRRPSISSRACSKHNRNKRCFAVIGFLQPPAVAVLVEERYGQSLRRALLLLESESMLPEASYETSRSDPVGLLQRISATQSDRTQYVLVVTDMADSFDRFSIAACSPGASSGSRATPGRLDRVVAFLQVPRHMSVVRRATDGGYRSASGGPRHSGRPSPPMGAFPQPR